MVYLISFDEKYLKIGFTKNVKKRLIELQTKIPEKLSVLNIIEGGFKEEKEIQKLFSKYSTSGEWFTYDYSIIEWFNSKPSLMWEQGFCENEENSIIGLIKSERLKNNLSMEDLGNLCNCTKQSIMDFERREIQGRITIAKMHKIAKALGKKFEYRFV